jgi:hypothetical protein
MATSLSGLAPPRQVTGSRKEPRGGAAYSREEPESVRELAHLYAKADAEAEAGQRGLGALVSHSFYGDEVQCVFERGMITKSIPTCS